MAEALPHWWERWNGRLDEEMDSFVRNGLHFEIDPEAFRLGTILLTGEIEVEGEERPVYLTIEYPESYPWTRFTVAAPELDLPRHQHPAGRTLCIFPRGSAHWDRTFVAGDIVNEVVPNLIKAVRRGGETMRDLEEAQAEPYTDYYQYYPHGAILVPQGITEGTQEFDAGRLTLKLAPSAYWLEVVGAGYAPGDLTPGGRGLVTSVQRGTTKLGSASEEIIKAIGGKTVTAEWVRMPQPPSALNVESFVREVEGLHPNVRWDRHKSWFGQKAGIAIVGVVFPEEVRQGETADSWVFLIYGKKARGKVQLRKGRLASKDQQVRCALVRGMRCDAEQLQERIPELRSLPSKSVAIAGLGSLGSPLAIEMARCLVGQLTIVDPDISDAGASVRWPGGFTAAGQLKVNWLADRLRVDYPYTEVRPRVIAIGAGTGHRELFQTDLRSADLLIDATAEDNVTAVLADYAWRIDIPLIAVWSIEGVGGVVVRILPGETGCFHCLELALSPDSGTIPLPKPAGMAIVQPKGCADPTFTAAGPDLLPLTDHASRLAFGELTRGQSGCYPRYHNDIHVLFLRQKDGSLYEPVRWDSHPLSVHPLCPLHGG